jgi:DNA-binding transcriptional LysR family regulator
VECFSGQYPGVRLQIIHANTSMQQFHELRKRDVDLLIGRAPGPFLEDDLALENLFDETFVAVAGPNSSWARRRSLELAELINEPWVLPPYDSVPGPFIMEVFRANNLKPPPARIVTLSLQLTSTLVATGRFLGILPSSVLRFSGRQVGLRGLPLKMPNHRAGHYIITIKNRTLSPLAERFIACARQVVKQFAV